MAWQFEAVAGPYEGPIGGVVWDRARGAMLFSTIDGGQLLALDHASKAVTELRRYTNRVNGLALGPNGELYGAQEGGRRLIELTPDRPTGAVGGWQRSGPGSLAYVFAPTGAVIESHPLPADGPNKCCFGGPDLDTLYVTTAGGQLYRAQAGSRRGRK